MRIIKSEWEEAVGLKEIWLHALSLTLLIYQRRGKITRGNILFFTPEYRESSRHYNVLWYKCLIHIAHIFFPSYCHIIYHCGTSVSSLPIDYWYCTWKILRHRLLFIQQGCLNSVVRKKGKNNQNSLVCNSMILKNAIWQEKVHHPN